LVDVDRYRSVGLNGDWHTIIDPYDGGLYNFHRETPIAATARLFKREYFTGIFLFVNGEKYGATGLVSPSPRRRR
jgi:hypothetical protein